MQRSLLLSRFMLMALCAFAVGGESTTNPIIRGSDEKTTKNITANLSNLIVADDGSTQNYNEVYLTSKESPKLRNAVNGTGLSSRKTFIEGMNCNMTVDPDSLSQDEFSTELTKSCRYDRLTKPTTDGPLNVSVQLDIRHIEAYEHMQFKMHMLVQYRYIDKRLDFSEISPLRGTILGEMKLRDKIWVPHVIIYNEKDSSIMGLEGKDVFISISPQGEVFYAYRMIAQIYCWQNLQKFPFDDQYCDIHFRSWTYNSSSLNLIWEERNPVMVANQLHLTEFVYKESSTARREIEADFVRGHSGTYSTLIFTFHVSREIGYYLMDYFIPSIMLVCTSWVTFWLQADNAAPRVTLGTSTMLSFITLASGQAKTLPKVSYVKASDIWFMGCIVFIFASMAEFAFVNIIWRRKKKVELKKVNSKYILRSTLTPSLQRRSMRKANSLSSLQKSVSMPSIDDGLRKEQSSPVYNNQLTIQSCHTVPSIYLVSEDDPGVQDLNLCDAQKNAHQSSTIINMQESDETLNRTNSTTMTPQEIAIWIDKRSRIWFPVCFVIFNIFYWSFVYLL